MSNWTRVTNFATNKYTLGAAVGLAGLAAGIGLTYSLMKDGEVKIPKPENVRVLELGDYRAILVEPNGYVLGIDVHGNLEGVDISKQKTPFTETKIARKGRDLKTRVEEESFEVSGEPMVVEKVLPGTGIPKKVSFKLKRK